MPEKDEESFLDELYTDHSDFANYAGVEESDEAAEVLDKQLNAGCLRAFDTLDATRSGLRRRRAGALQAWCHCEKSSGPD